MATHDPTLPPAPASAEELLAHPIPVRGRVPAHKLGLAFRFVLVLTVGLGLLACEEDTRIPGFPAPPLVVTEAAPHGWVKQIAGSTSVMFSPGPAMPLLGQGSARYTTGPDHNFALAFARLRNTEYHGIPLASITHLSYSTYIERRDTTTDTPFMVLQIDTNGDGTFDDNLNFQPWYQTGHFILPGGVPDQGRSRNNTWQTWDALRGGWFPFTTAEEDPDHNGQIFTLASYLKRYPKATIRNQANGLGGIRIQVGGPVFGNNFIGYADQVTIGVNGLTTTYDFEN